MTTPKNTTKNYVTNIDLFTGFSCSERTSKVDLEQIAKDCNSALAIDGVASGLAIKFNLHGNKIKPGDFVQVAGVPYMCKDLLDKIHDFQKKKGVDVDGSVSKGSGAVGIAKISDKRVASVTRISRAFAKTTSFLIEKGKIALPEDLAFLSNGTGVPSHFSFLAAPYGMTDDELKLHGVGFIKFCENFNDAVEVAYVSGGLDTTTGNKRDHAADFRNYMKWRNVVV